MKKVSLLSETVYCIVDAAALACAGILFVMYVCMMGGLCFRTLKLARENLPILHRICTLLYLKDLI